MYPFSSDLSNLGSVDSESFFFHPTPTPFRFLSIDVDQYLAPFVDLLSRGINALFLRSIKVISISHDIFSAGQVVIDRLILAPPFDPTSHSFKTEIQKLAAKEALLQNRIKQLDLRFCKDYQIIEDMAELKQLYQEVYESFVQLDSYVKQLKGRSRRFSVQNELERVRNIYEALNEQVEDYHKANLKKIVVKFNETVSLFVRKGAPLSDEIKKDLIQTYHHFREIYDRFLSNHYSISGAEYGDIVNSMEAFIADKFSFSPECKGLIASSSFTEPLKLQNIGNSCYLDSALQSILCIDSLREKLTKIPEKEELKLPSQCSANEQKRRKEEAQKSHRNRLAIQREISLFIENQKETRINKPLSQMELVLYLLSEDHAPSLYRLRRAIFSSQFHAELNDSRNSRELSNQHDAAYIVELLIDHLIPDCKFKWQTYHTTEILPGLKFANGGKEGREETLSVLQLSWHKISSKIKKNSVPTLGDLAKITLGKRRHKTERTFNPKEDGKVIPGKEIEAAKVIDASETKAEEFIEWHEITQLPPVLAVQIKRFNYSMLTGESTKEKGFVELPKDGILDLSDYYTPSPGEPKNARYRIKSMVRHIGGSLEYGHYVASVEIGGKYYHCDDMSSKCYEEIDGDQFFETNDPYLIFLERIPDDEFLALKMSN